MMVAPMNLLRKNFNNGVKGTLAGLFIVCLIYGMSVRIGAEQSFIQHCLTIVSDHYYLLYFMLPLFLLLCFFVIEDDSEVVILRYKTYFRYFINKWLSLVVISLSFVVVQLSAIILSGVGLSMSAGWHIVEGSITLELFNVFSAHFTSPTLCFAAVYIYMLAGLCIVALFALWIGHFLSKSWTVKILVFLYLISLLSMRIGFIRELPVTLFNHITILHHNLSGEYRLAITVATSAALVCVMFWTVKRFWNRQLRLMQRHARGITPYYCKELISRKTLIILGSVAALMVIWKYLQSAGNLTGEEWVIRLFAGHGTGYFHVLSFIEMLLLNGTPLYLLAVFIEKVTTEHSTFITVRLNRRKDILNGILTSALLLLLLYGSLLIAVPLIGLTLAGFPLDGNILSVLGLSVGLKLLDISTQLVFIMVLYCLTGQITIAFLALVAVNFLCVVPFALTKYLPFGMSSLSRIDFPQAGNEGLLSPYAIGILLITSGLFTIWLFAVGYKRLPKN